ncbi:Filamentous hemagglutinin family N-terminal domain [Hyella patelloides LEGE 07179]|uniref:Filamentous hemagglutinin family N-terminal domain n=1 Tax=Hyella patelloides LEGE 07179 TaxID=945734 RepID=A0A563VWE2_9CYAN|nr:filamentous hemagglutinin N-terminal domain-containing protein [Hyella patelloides]VEP15573.1 Filamentous hemagglutinin family N-terminal domain [Hyella patelloides LEGE 07179]
MIWKNKDSDRLLYSPQIKSLGKIIPSPILTIAYFHACNSISLLYLFATFFNQPTIMKFIDRFGLFSGLFFSSIIVLPSSAQITVDGTTSTDVSPTETGVQIDNGDRNSGNLFHSFGEFSVPTGTEAFFNNANDIVNIFSRVTGGNISNIDGILRANGAANLFLINPAGIVFGENASLQLGGSFYGSTADSIIFPDGEFSATDLENPPLITINAPIGLGFREEPGDIVHRSAANGFGLFVNEGNTLALIGGNVNLENGSITFAPGGTVELGGLAATGTIDITEDGSLSFPNDVAKGNVSISDSSLIAVFLLGESDLDLDTGDIKITANSLAINNGATLLANTLGQGNGGEINITTGSLTLSNGATLRAITSGQGNAGNVTINATENMTLDGQNESVGIFTGVLDEAIGNGGEINVTTGSLTLSNGATLNAVTSGQGNAGNVVVNARENISFDSQGSNSNNGIFSFTDSAVTGKSGNVEINANSITLDNGSEINIDSVNEVGDISINAIEIVSLSNGSSILARGADRGSINIEAENLELTAGSDIFAGIASNSGFAEAQAGDITISLTEDLTIDSLDREIITNITNQNFGTGNAGNIGIDARNIFLSNSGQISSLSSGQGNTGNITLNATGDIVVDGANSDFVSQISLVIGEEGIGNIGDIDIQAQNLTITNGGEIRQGVLGAAGNSGDINLKIADTILVDGFAEVLLSEDEAIVDTLPLTPFFRSSIGSLLGNNSIGDSGDININTKNLFLSRNGSIFTSPLGQGDAGDVNINAEVITIGEQGNTSIAPSNILNGAVSGILDPSIEGNAGNVTINTNSLSISDGGDINTSITGVGKGGDIKITATEFVSVNGTGILNGEEFPSEITASTAPDSTGDGGNIDIITPKLSVTNFAEIRSQARGEGNAGFINITANDSLTLANTGVIRAEVRPGATGNGGSISIETNNLNLRDGSLIGVDVLEEAIGNGGNIIVETETLTLSEGSQISATTSGNGNAGSLTINATESINLSGTQEQSRGGFFAGAFIDNGKGGDIFVSTGELTISDGATITVSNFSSLGFLEPGTGESGNLRVEADSVTLDNDARIDAATQSGNGGNITFEVAENLTLRNNSLISARAFNRANGGNINIDAELIIAFPNQNNDIIANAQQGRGGNINITVESLFGIEERPLNPVTNDINASSDFGLDGTVFINTLDTNSLRGTAELPVKIVASEVVTSDACSASQTEDTSGLAVRGKGGVPPQPTEPFEGEVVIVGEQTSIGNSNVESNQLANRESSQSRENSDNPNFIPSHIKPVATTEAGEKLYLARGVIKQDDGTIILTAYPTTSNNSRDAINSGNCQ